MIQSVPDAILAMLKVNLLKSITPRLCYVNTLLPTISWKVAIARSPAGTHQGVLQDFFGALGVPSETARLGMKCRC